jgi:hypothetical protein
MDTGSARLSGDEPRQLGSSASGQRSAEVLIGVRDIENGRAERLSAVNSSCLPVTVWRRVVFHRFETPDAVRRQAVIEHRSVGYFRIPMSEFF